MQEMIKKFTQAQRQAIKHVMSQPGWDEVLFYVEESIKSYNEEPVKADTEFETLWRTAQREAKSDVLKSFFNSLEEEILK